MQPSFRYDIDDAIQGFESARLQVIQRVDRRLGRGAEEVAREAKRRAQAQGAMAFSTLVNSIRATRERLLRYVVAHGVNYGGYVEEGSEPGGMPPIQSLIDWMRVKRITPRNPKNTIEETAALIALKIAHQGIEAKPHMRPALEAKRSRLHALVQQGVDEGLQAAGVA